MGIYAALDEVKRRNNQNMLAGFSRGTALENSIYESLVTDHPPVLLKRINSRGLEHGKSDTACAPLYCVQKDGNQVRVVAKFNARPDFVYQNSGCVSIIDSKLGDPYPDHLIQAHIIRQIYLCRYHINPRYYLFTNNGTQLYELDLLDEITNVAFAMFCIGCMAWQNLVLRNGGLGGLFGGHEEVGWDQVLGEGVDPQKVARESFGIIAACFDSLLTQRDGVG